MSLLLCPNCGIEIAAETTICPECGYEVLDAADSCSDLDFAWVPQKEDLTPPFILTFKAGLLTFLAFAITVAISVRIQHPYLGIATGLAMLSFFTYRRFKRRKELYRKAIRSGCDVAGMEKSAAEFREEWNALKQWDDSIVPKLLLALLVAIIIFAAVLYIGYTFSPITAGLVLTFLLLAKVKISGVKDDSGRWAIKPIRIRHTLMMLREICTTLARDICVAVCTLVICSIFLYFLVSVIPAMGNKTFTVISKVISTAAVLGFTVGGLALKVTLASHKNVDADSSEYFSEVENQREEAGKHLLPAERIMHRLVYQILARPTLTPAVYLGALIASFAFLSTLGGAGHLSDLTVPQSFLYVLNALGDVLFQGTLKTFGVSISNVSANDTAAHLYTILLKFLILVMVAWYVYMAAMHLKHIRSREDSEADFSQAQA